MKKDKGTYIFGSYYSSDDIDEIETNPIFKNTVVKSILDLRYANENLKQEILKTKLFNFIKGLIEKLLNYILKVINFLE